MDSKDPLAKYKRAPIEPQPSGVTAVLKKDSEYEAFDAKDKVRRIRIRPLNDSTYSPQYLDLSLIAYDGEAGTNFVLVFGLITVRVRGRNLQGIITALETDSAAFIQQFDPERWQRPRDPEAPIIEWMEVVSGDDGASTQAESQTGQSSKPH